MDIVIQAGFILCQGYIPEKVSQIEIAHIEHKIPMKKVYFLGVWGLTTSSYIEHDYNISGHMDL